MPSDSLKKSTISAARWLMLRSLVGESLAISSMLVLARLISPAGFGHAAVALVFSALAVVVTFEGFASVLVQRQVVENTQRSTAVLLTLGAGLLMSAVLFASATLVWRPLFGRATASLIALVSPCFVVASVGAVSRASLWRALDFRRLTKIEIGGRLGGEATAVALAASGFGARSLVIGAIVASVLSSVMLLAAAPPPWPRWHRREAGEIVGFGAPAALAGVIGQLFANVDYWILAARLNAYQTGIYYRAFNLGVAYQAKISSVMMQLSFPVYSRLESREEMRRLHERVARAHAMVIFPLLALLAVLAPVLVPFLFGAVWRPAAGPAQIMAVGGMVAAILTGYPQVMRAVGDPQTLLRFDGAMMLLYAAAVTIAAAHGLLVVAGAVVGVYILILIGAYRFLLGPHLGVSLRALVQEMAPAIVGCIAVVSVCEPLQMALAPILPPPLLLVLLIPAGLIAYALTVRGLFGAAWRDLLALAAAAVPPLARFSSPAAAAASASVTAPG